MTPATNVQQLLDEIPIAQRWSREAHAAYLRFSERLMHDQPLTVTIGAGGLSYYKRLGKAKVFVCHLNATPRSGERDTLFADFRLASLAKCLDVDAVIAAFEAAADDDIHVSVSKTWCALHFPPSRLDDVADLFVQHVINQARL